MGLLLALLGSGAVSATAFPTGVSVTGSVGTLTASAGSSYRRDSLIAEAKTFVITELANAIIVQEAKSYTVSTEQRIFTATPTERSNSITIPDRTWELAA